MKSLRTAYIFWLPSLFGLCGLHRFYLGKPLSGLLFLFTFGLYGIGTVYDAIAMTSHVQQARLREGIAGRVSLNELFEDPADGRVYTQSYVRQSSTTGQSMEQTILQIAKQSNGYVAASEVALQSGVSMEQASTALDVLTGKGFCELIVRDNGSLVYYFSDLDREGSHRI
ncbi:TM2 domain-containing protein [Spirochaeta dissipatitropha]